VTARLDGVEALAARFDGFILDQWGVLHDGTRAYPGAADCLRLLREAGKPVVVLSNSGRREAENVRLMERAGFARDLYDRLVVAGEHAREALRVRDEPFHRALGRRCYVIARRGDRALLEGIGLDFVERIEEADFVALIGTDAPHLLAADYEATLAAARARDLPMVCANPDLLRLTPDGMTEAPGVLARRYEALGGRVFYHGKPHAPIYRTAIDLLRRRGCARIVAVGDSIEHDILGAAGVGLPSAFIAGGVHAAALGVAWGEMPLAESWRRFAAAQPAMPEFLLAVFRW
jgi:HAD superfamily hydrolase (TIGR01459 family)